MPQYKLMYFNLQGRAELSRVIFAYAGEKYEDIRYEFPEFPAIKPTLPFLQLPVLEIDGVRLTQSHTIARYLARKFNIAGKNDLEAAQADAYIDLIYDILDAVKPVHYETDPEKKKELMVNLVAEKIIPTLAIVEKQLKANGSQYLVGSSLTWADIAMYTYLTTMVGMMGPTILARCIHLKMLVNRVGNIPNIKKYVDRRPETM